MTAKISLEIGIRHPYDEGSIMNDKYYRAARGVIADLMDRRDIKQPFYGVDDDVRIEIVEALADVIKLAVEEWQPISTAPKDGTWILVLDSCRNEKVVQWETPRKNSQNAWCTEFWYDEDTLYTADNPTHWQPLPEPPKVMP